MEEPRRTVPVSGPSQTPVGPERHALLLHAEVDYVHKQGLGIGITQRIVCQTKKGHSRIVKIEERKYGIKVESFTSENVKTLERAYMLALLHALGLAFSTITKSGNKSAKRVEEVKVLMTSTKFVRAMNKYIQDFSDDKSLQDVKKANDRLMIKRAVSSAPRLSRCGVEVSIVAVDKQDADVARARTLARQKGSKACKSRYRLQRAWEEGI